MKEKETIFFRIEGPTLEEHVPLHTVTTALSEFLHIIDQTYLVLTGQKKVTTRRREEYLLAARHFRVGSFDAEIDIFVVASQLVLPLLAHFGPKALLHHAT